MPERRMGKLRQFRALYFSAHPAAVLRVTCRNARPKGRSGIALRAYALDSRRRKKVAMVPSSC